MTKWRVIIHKYSRKSGFTIVEIMVVMAIMALMSTMGIAAMVGINTNALADRAAENILSQLREAQNKAFSVASEPNNPNAYPVSWGVKIDPSAASPKDMFSSYYIDGTPPYALHPFAYDSSDVNYKVDSIKAITMAEKVGYDSVFLNYTAPFAKYYLQSANEPCEVMVEGKVQTCEINESLPHDIVFPGKLEEAIVVTISFRGVEKEITIEANGEAVISG